MTTTETAKVTLEFLVKEGQGLQGIKKIEDRMKKAGREVTGVFQEGEKLRIQTLGDKVSAKEIQSMVGKGGARNPIVGFSGMTSEMPDIKEINTRIKLAKESERLEANKYRKMQETAALQHANLSYEKKLISGKKISVNEMFKAARYRKLEGDELDDHIAKTEAHNRALEEQEEHRKSLAFESKAERAKEKKRYLSESDFMDQAARKSRQEFPGDERRQQEYMNQQMAEYTKIEKSFAKPDLWKRRHKAIKVTGDQMLALNMASLGVYFSLLSVMMIMKQGAQMIMAPLADAGKMIRSVAMATAFSSDAMKEFLGNNADTGKMVDAWMRFTGLKSSLEAIMGIFAVNVFSPELTEALEKSIIELGKSLSDPKLIQGIQEIFKVIGEALPGIIGVFKQAIGFVVFLTKATGGALPIFIMYAAVIGGILFPVLAFANAVIQLARAIAYLRSETLASTAANKAHEQSMRMSTITARRATTIAMGAGVVGLGLGQLLTGGTTQTEIPGIEIEKSWKERLEEVDWTSIAMMAVFLFSDAIMKGLGKILTVAKLTSLFITTITGMGWTAMGILAVKLLGAGLIGAGIGLLVVKLFDELGILEWFGNLGSKLGNILEDWHKDLIAIFLSPWVLLGGAVLGIVRGDDSFEQACQVIYDVFQRTWQRIVDLFNRLGDYINPLNWGGIVGDAASGVGNYMSDNFGINLNIATDRAYDIGVSQSTRVNLIR